MYRAKVSESVNDVFDEIESELNNVVENLSNIESDSSDIDEMIDRINNEVNNLKDIVKKLY